MSRSEQKVNRVRWQVPASKLGLGTDTDYVRFSKFLGELAFQVFGIQEKRRCSGPLSLLLVCIEEERQLKPCFSWSVIDTLLVCFFFHSCASEEKSKYKFQIENTICS